MYTTKAQICIRRDTAANFTSANPTLALGEIAYETDTRNIKVGDGATAWTALGYINPYRGGTAAAPTSNTVIGSGAGAAMQSGAARNVAIGPSALAAATTATGNIGIGQNTLRGVTTATLNTAVGDNSMNFSGSVTGTQNVGVGYQALQVVQTGIYNTAVGARSAEALDTASNVVAVGYKAALLNKSSDITAVGTEALDANTTGTNNTAVGKDALGANTTGAGNVAIGNLAGSALTTGSNNVAIGLESLSSGGSTVYSSVGIGYRALWQNTGGANVAIGANAQNASAATTGVVAIGNSAALFNTASGTTAIGSGALDANTTGTLNTAVGLNALGSYTTGEGSTAVGYQALLSTTTQNYSTAVGSTAAATGQHSESCMLGWGAANSFGPGYSPITSTAKGVFVGYNARPGIGNGTGEICIGADCVGNGSNTTTIGNSSTTAAWLAGTLYPGRADSTRFGTSGFSIRSTGSDNGVWQAAIATADVSNRFSVRSNDGATDRFTVANGGDATIHNGNLIIGTSGKGIDFSATANSSGTMTSELLSDYEEGTFTPTFSQGITSPVYTTQTGHYTKIGRMVFFRVLLDLSSGTANASQLRIGGLPFTAAASSNNGGAYVTYMVNWLAASTSSFPRLVIDNGSTEIQANSNSTGAGVAGTDFNGVLGAISLTGQYFV